ncbi:hypothetical protein JVT61DRAFT_3224 [Boletus reticuloceps]|uniref:Uncharacterized protein n=1 Tax=Boletus reticuloceps TaxID=495285 RepID=A0A8I2YMM9_9AGAM|nr:hypothetical protein JVT61DRAFT_3224 [Boletus reticuloceps]
MPSKRLTVFLPEGIGIVSRFGKSSRRYVKVKNGSLQDGDILLQLTLKELGVIRKVSKKMRRRRPELFKDAKDQYDDLKDEFDRLAEAQDSTSWIKFLKRLEIRRDTHTLVDAGYELYITVKSTSEKLERVLLSSNSLVEEAEARQLSIIFSTGDIPENAKAKGFAFIVEDSELLDDEEVSNDDEEASDDDSIAPDDADNQITSTSCPYLFQKCAD